MGNALATILGSLIEIYNKIMKKDSSLNTKKREYYNSEILLKDEENQAGKKKLTKIYYQMKI